MNSRVVVLALLASGAQAETYLCVSQVGAAVEESGSMEFSAGLIENVSNSKYIFKNDDGKWSLKRLGDNYAFLDNCDSEYVCQRSDIYAGTFLRTKRGTFSIVYLNMNGKDERVFVEKGRCSSI